MVAPFLYCCYSSATLELSDVSAWVHLLFQYLVVLVQVENFQHFALRASHSSTRNRQARPLRGKSQAQLAATAVTTLSLPYFAVSPPDLSPFDSPFAVLGGAVRASKGSSELIAAVPLYFKHHSIGKFNI